LHAFPAGVGVGVAVGVAVGVRVGVSVGVAVGIISTPAAFSETFCCCLTNKTPATILKVRNITIIIPTIMPAFPTFFDFPVVIISKGDV
jgi:zinc transporter ZupT